MHQYFDKPSYRSHILQPHWNLLRAAKPGSIRFWFPHPKPEEWDTFKSGEPGLNPVGYIEDIKTIEYALLQLYVIASFHEPNAFETKSRMDSIHSCGLAYLSKWNHSWV